MQYVKKAAKAFYAALVAGLGALATTLTGEQNLGDLTTLQWVIIAGVVVGAFGGVYGITNAKPQ